MNVEIHTTTNDRSKCTPLYLGSYFRSQTLETFPNGLPGDFREDFCMLDDFSGCRAKFNASQPIDHESDVQTNLLRPSTCTH